MLSALEPVFTRIGAAGARALRVHAVRARPARPEIPFPVVLVHGAIISGRYMRPTLRRLGLHAECWAPDLPGQGRSSTPPRQLDLPEYAEALVAWMDSVGLERALLVGNSFGSQVIAHVAERHPERALGLVLVGPTVDMRARRFLAQVWRVLVDAFHERFSLWLLELADMIRMGPVRMAAMVRVTLADRIEEVLPGVRAPVLVVRGELDTLSQPDWCAYLAGLARAPAVIEVPGASHGLNYDAPEALTAIVLAFARELASSVTPATGAAPATPAIRG